MFGSFTWDHLDHSPSFSEKGCMAGCRVDRLFIMVLHYSQRKINLVMIGRTYHCLSSQADVKNLTQVKYWN